MGIQVADLDGGEWTAYSSNGDQTNPITTVHDGRIEQSRDVLLYVRNDDAAKKYTDVVIGFADSEYPNDIEGVQSGWSIKVSLGNLQPSDAEWATITAGTSISISDPNELSGIGREPFWYRIISPRGIHVGLKLDVSLRLSYTESTI